MDKTLVEEIQELEAKIAGDEGTELTAKITDLEERLIRYKTQQKEAGQNSSYMGDDDLALEVEPAATESSEVELTADDDFDELDIDDDFDEIDADDEFIDLDDDDDDDVMSYMKNLDDKMSMMMRYMRRSSQQSRKKAREATAEEEILDLDDGESRMVEASSRLDRVAAYLEESGHDKLAFKIDTLTDAIDENRLSN
jgi:hypothetical protein